MAGAGEPLITQGGFDLILSIGQVVRTKLSAWRITTRNSGGTGGAIRINRSHYLGAVYGMERIMGVLRIPCATFSNYAADHFLDICLSSMCLPWSGGRRRRAGSARAFIGDDAESFIARRAEPES